MDLFGRGYVIEHCISTLKRKGRERVYRAYVTDSLKIIGENTTYRVGGDRIIEVGGRLTSRWIEIEDPAKRKKEPEVKEDTRSCTEIANDIFARAGVGG